MSKNITRWMGSMGASVLFAGLFAVVLIPSARGDDFDQRTVVTIDQPLEVPGAVLAPGTYVFKLFDSNAERQVVQVYNAGTHRLVASFVGFPTYRVKPSRHTILQFEESPNSVHILREWYYPGDSFGLAFRYPR
jgi:hypothetical protein